MLKQFIYKTIIIIFISTALCVSIFQFYFPSKFLLLYGFLPLVFGIINIIIFKFLVNAGDSTLLKFSNRYLLCTTVKLLGSIFFILGFLIFNKEHAIPFLSTFLIVYLVFLTQEIVGILNFFKKKSKSESSESKT